MAQARFALLLSVGTALACAAARDESSGRSVALDASSDSGSNDDAGLSVDGEPGGLDAKPTKKLDPGKDNDGDGWVLEDAQATIAAIRAGIA